MKGVDRLGEKGRPKIIWQVIVRKKISHALYNTQMNYFKVRFLKETQDSFDKAIIMIISDKKQLRVAELWNASSISFGFLKVIVCIAYEN